MRIRYIEGGFILLALVPVLFVLGCMTKGDSNETLRGPEIPNTIYFEGKTYKNTGDVVAIERTPYNVEYAGRIFLQTPVIPFEGDGLEVYSIKGLDKNQYVALKCQLVGEKGASYYYFKYKIQSP